LTNHGGENESKLHFGFNERVHLMHVAGNPHHPHLNCHQDYRYHRHSSSERKYFLFASRLSSLDWLLTSLSMKYPATTVINSQARVPTIKGPAIKVNIINKINSEKMSSGRPPNSFAPENPSQYKSNRNHSMKYFWLFFHFLMESE
jgi:hypothetical protein